MEETSHIRGPKSSAGVTLTLTPSIILSAKEKETSLLFTNRDYKGLPARSRRKVQTHCHLRGNFPCLGEEQAPMKSTESLADIATRLLGIARSSPQTARVRRDALLASFLISSPPSKTLRGSSWRTAPSAPSPRERHCRQEGRCEERPPNLAPTPWSGVSTLLQAEGHRRSRTPQAKCSSANPTDAEGR